MGRIINFLFFIPLILPVILNGQFGDCTTAKRICSIDSYFFEPDGNGQKQESLSQLKASKNFKETHSVWLFWDVEEKGDFTFELIPGNLDDDLDFTVFKSDLNGCISLKQVRSVFSGADLPFYIKSNKCLGTTGLDYRSEDLYESNGCSGSQDNFVQFVTANRGERYYILINNYSASNPFEFKMKGTLGINSTNCASTYAQALSTGPVLILRPNPVADDLHINLFSENSLTDAGIIDMMGQQVRKLDLRNFNGGSHTVNLSNLSSGTYIVRIETQQEILEKRFIKI